MLFLGGGSFCCYWRQIGIPDKCGNVSKLRREAEGELEVNVAYLGIITAIERFSQSGHLSDLSLFGLFLVNYLLSNVESKFYYLVKLLLFSVSLIQVFKSDTLYCSNLK